MSRNLPPDQSASGADGQVAWLASLVIVSGTLGATLGVCALLGWQFNLGALKSVFPGWVEMKPNTALGLALLGPALILRGWPKPPPTADRIVRTLGLVAALIGLATLVEYSWSVQLGIDQLLYLDATDQSLYPGRMGVNTAACFALLGFAHAVGDARSQWRALTSQLASLLASLVTLITLFNYLLHVPVSQGVTLYAHMALNTAIAFLILALGTLCVWPSRGLMPVVTNAQVSGRAVRILLATVFTITPILAFLRLRGQELGWYGTEFGLAIFALSQLTTLAVVIWCAGYLLHRVDTRRAAAESARNALLRELETANAGLEQTIAERTSALRESERRFHSAFDYAAIGMALVSPEGRWLQVNRAVCDIVGYSERELLALTFQDVTHPDDLGNDLEYVRQVLSGEIDSYQMEKRYVHKQGRVVWVLLSVSLVRTEDGAPLHFISQIQDISARKAAEQAARKSEERFKLVVEGTHDGVWDWDIGSGYCYYSPRYKQLLGYSDEEFEATRASFEARLHPADRERTYAALRAHLGHRTPYEVEYRLQSKSGEYLWFQARGQASWDADGRPIRFAGALRDITQRKQAELAAERSQKFLDAVIEGIPQPLFVKDSRHRWVLFNQRFCEMMGHERSALLGHSDPDIYPPDVVERFWAEDEESLRMSEPLYVESAVTRPDGSTRWLLKSKQRIDLQDGAHIVGISTDITSLKQAQTALEQSEESHRLLAEHSIDMILRIDPWGVLTYVSPASLSMLGYRPDEVVGRRVPDFVHPQDREEAARLYGEVVRLKTFHVFTCRLRNHSGGWVWVETSFRAIPDPDTGRTAQVIAVSRNVDERMQAAEALNRFKQILDNTIDMIFMFDTDTLRYSYVNRGAADTLGYPREKLLGMAPWELRGNITEAEYRKTIEAFLRGEIQSRQFETVHRRADGEVIPVDVSMQIIRRPGETGMFLSVTRDATERKKIERMKNEFVSTVSHELRTPLTAILGSLGLIAGGVAGELSEQAKKLIEIARKNGERLVRLINDILDMDKIESGKMRFDFQPHRIRPLLEQAVEANRAYGDSLGVQFELRGEIPDRVVALDSDRFMQVMANLLSNAAKFSPSGGTVAITSEVRPGGVRINVTDQGPGIPEHFRDKVFGKFCQADASDSRQKGGTGLGLSIVKAIMEKHGGEVGFDTEIGRGTTFHVTFPEASRGAVAGVPAAVVHQTPGPVCTEDA